MTKQVLILDDNADNRKLLFYALMAGDYEIHQAELRNQVPDLIKHMDIDLALLDIELPDGDGLELAAQLRAKNPDTVVIMLSANDNVDRLEKARAVGVAAYVIKPFNLPKLLDFIRSTEIQSVYRSEKMHVL
jgi:DNA-binding response OmpR family regulator